ncbi:hypothetical protein ETB97_005528 [Aspergillus alliaceus]|uniref:Uncharacterized protein n=1 Tax=Petromyces alliaceus TaxID=209559 RepID=A0A8H6A041_PETAA|nr:hypothetical protein ETB97_005528 [Aspergillus burnettii]
MSTWSTQAQSRGSNSATDRTVVDYLSPNLRNALVDEYANEKQPSDGEVYRKICQYQHEHNARFQKRWWSRLSENKAKRLRQLTSSKDNVDLCAAFDALLAIPGLWNGMSLGFLNKEIIHYLKHIETFWGTLVNFDCVQMAKIDLQTVDTLQLRAPKASKVDETTVEGLILSGEVFPEFSRLERTAIWERLQHSQACEGVIPSLFTFFQDISYLIVCADAVKRLVVLHKKHPTIQSAFVHSFRPDRANEGCLIQTSETNSRRQQGSSEDQREIGYRQVWMYAMRNYPEMAKDVQSLKVKAKPTRAKADERIVYDMAALARDLGFRSKQIEAILKQSPDRQIARAALLKARKPDRYHYDKEVFESLVNQISQCFSHAAPNQGQPAAGLITGRVVKLKDRCGIPPEQIQQLDRPHLFVD